MGQTTQSNAIKCTVILLGERFYMEPLFKLGVRPRVRARIARSRVLRIMG